MPVKKAESRIPDGLTPEDLGEVQYSSDKKVVLVSYYQSPVTAGRKQFYVVMVTDSALQSQVDKYHWVTSDKDEETAEGVWEYTPAADATSFTVIVTLKKSTGESLYTVALSQTVTIANEELENLIEQSNTTYPVAGDPHTSREVINDFLGLIHALAPVDVDNGVLNSFLFATSYIAALSHDQEKRHKRLSDLRSVLEGGDAQAALFFEDLRAGAGICVIRPQVFALNVMVPNIPTWLPLVLRGGFGDFPPKPEKRDKTLEKLHKALVTLTENTRIDIFNTLRFPKANLKCAKMIAEAVQQSLFSSHALSSIVAVQADVLRFIDQYQNGAYKDDGKQSSTAHARNVLAMMVSNLYVLLGAIPPPLSESITNKLSSFSATTPSVFGKPESVPEETYIVEALTGDNGFIQTAVDYHTTYGLSPVTATSLEHLVATLAAKSTPLNRMRLVGHVGVDTSTLDARANLGISFFQGGQRTVWGEMLAGFGTSNELGLRAIIDYTTYNSITKPYLPDITEKIILALRVADSKTLEPFGLHNSFTTTGDFRLFLFACNDLLYLQYSAISTDFARVQHDGKPVTDDEREYFKTALNTIADEIKTRLIDPAITKPALDGTKLDELKTAILGLSYWLLRTTFPMYTSAIDYLLSVIRNGSNSNVLDPLNLRIQAPQGDVQKFLFACNDYWVAKTVLDKITAGKLYVAGHALSDSQQADLLSVLMARVNHFAQEITATSGSPTATEVAALQAEIFGLNGKSIGITTLNDFSYPSSPGFQNFRDEAPFNYFGLINEANQAIARGFRSNLNSAKKRFTVSSWIDIRGCRIAQDKEYMPALQKFFGEKGKEPSVSGPDWFQAFAESRESTFTTEAQVDDLFKSGNSAHSSSIIKTLFTKIRTYTGTSTHISFWQIVSALTDFEFAALIWKTHTPGLPIESVKLKDFDTLSLTETLKRTAEIFNITSVPDADLSRIEARHGEIFALQSEMETLEKLGSTPDPAELSGSYTRLKLISTQLSLSVVPSTEPASLSLTTVKTYIASIGRFLEIVTLHNGPEDLYKAWEASDALAAQSSPSSTDITAQFEAFTKIQSTITDKTIVPAAAPGTLTAAMLQDYAKQFYTYFESKSQMNIFRLALNKKASYSTIAYLAEFRYYFFIGLPLVVDKPGYLWFYAMESMKDDAVLAFMKVQWESVPTAMTALPWSSTESRRVALLQDTRGTNKWELNPYEGYRAHIIRTTGLP